VFLVHLVVGAEKVDLEDAAEPLPATPNPK
jgi:hypothetical protein